jgi:hypothetical protein
MVFAFLPDFSEVATIFLNNTCGWHLSKSEETARVECLLPNAPLEFAARYLATSNSSGELDTEAPKAPLVTLTWDYSAREHVVSLAATDRIGEWSGTLTCVE